jgi:CAAX protease family protein
MPVTNLIYRWRAENRTFAMTSSAFRRYVDAARERAGLWRIGLGSGLILLLWGASTIAAFALGGVFGAFVLGGRLAEDPNAFVDAVLASPAGVEIALLSFSGMAAGVFLAVRWVHWRPMGTVLGASGRLAWGDFRRGLSASLIASALAELLTLLVDSSVERSAIGLGTWFLWLVPTILLLFLQVSAEELTFRGYLLQSLAARFRSPIVWALLPLALFTALHWNAHSSLPMAAAMLASIAAFAATATVLVVRTGNLAAGIGAHLGLNTFGILGVSHMSWLSGLALFRGKPVDLGDWSDLDAFFVGLLGVAPFVLVALLLLHPRSPLRVGEA